MRAACEWGDVTFRGSLFLHMEPMGKGKAIRAKGEAQTAQDGTMGSCFWIIDWALLTHSFSPWQEEAGEEQSCLCWGCGSDRGSHFSREGGFHCAPETFHPQVTARKAPTKHKHVLSHSAAPERHLEMPGESPECRADTG